MYPGGSERWISTTARLLRDPSGKPVQFIGILKDITARKHAEAHQQMLLDELNHRVKNTLATVQSIAAQTLRTNPEPALFREAFESRLLALSKTHDLLTRNAWRDADLSALLDQEFSPYRREGDHRVSLRGPRLRLPARVAINLGLVLHELVTNAAKYGALSVAQGRLGVEWSLEPAPCGNSRLRFTWRETNGPPVSPPKREGFGLASDPAQHRRRAGGRGFLALPGYRSRLRDRAPPRGGSEEKAPARDGWMITPDPPRSKWRMPLARASLTASG